MLKDDDPLRRGAVAMIALYDSMGQAIASHLKPEFAAAHYFNSGEAGNGRRIIETLFDASHNIRSPFPGVVAGLWADQATLADSEMLHQIASHSDLEPFVVAQIFRGLMRIDPLHTLQESFLDPDRIVEDDAIQSRVLESLQGPCSQPVAGYLSKLLAVSPSICRLGTV